MCVCVCVCSRDIESAVPGDCQFPDLMNVWPRNLLYNNAILTKIYMLCPQYGSQSSFFIIDIANYRYEYKYGGVNGVMETIEGNEYSDMSSNPTRG